MRNLLSSLKVCFKHHWLVPYSMFQSTLISDVFVLYHQAKSTLRKKKLAMKSVERKEATLDTLQQMIDRIHNAETDHMVSRLCLIHRC